MGDPVAAAGIGLVGSIFGGMSTMNAANTAASAQLAIARPWLRAANFALPALTDRLPGGT